MARQGIVGLVAMHVDGKAARGGDLAELGDRARALGHAALEMRDAAHDIHALVEGTQQVLPRRGMAEEPVLREGDELEVEEGADLALHLEQGLDREELVVADIHMAADGEAAARDRPAAELMSARLDGLDLKMRLQLRPERDALQQRAALVEPRPAEAQGRIHMEMGIDEGGRHQPAAQIDLPRRLGLEGWLDPRDPAISDGDIVVLAAIRQIGAAQDEVEHHVSSPRALAPVSTGRSMERPPAGGGSEVEFSRDARQE